MASTCQRCGLEGAPLIPVQVDEEQWGELRVVIAEQCLDCARRHLTEAAARRWEERIRQILGDFA